ncbi:hypothetical protein RSAG8_08235, partial [Rhizoctonia solani AG-8 WAC10335]
MNNTGADIFSQGAAGLALAASALAEASQALSKAAAALSVIKKPRSIGYQTLETTMQVVGSHETENGKDPAWDNNNYNASSAGANTGNYVHWKDITTETPGIEDYVSTWGPSQANHESFDRTQQADVDPLDGLICSGRHYLVLEEEFDALPLILAYATAGERTTCYVPTSGSLFPWLSIVSQKFWGLPTSKGG